MAIVAVPGFPGEEAAQSIIDEIRFTARRFGLTLTDAFDRDHSAGHKSPGHNITGTAADFSGSDTAMDAAAKYWASKGYIVGYDGRFGTQAWPGHGPSYVAGSNAHLHVEFDKPGAATVAVGGTTTGDVGGGGWSFIEHADGSDVGGVLGTINDAVTGAVGVAGAAAGGAVSAVEFATDPIGWIWSKGAYPLLTIALVFAGLAVAALGVARMTGMRAPVPIPGAS